MESDTLAELLEKVDDDGMRQTAAGRNGRRNPRFSQDKAMRQLSKPPIDVKQSGTPINRTLLLLTDRQGTCCELSGVVDWNQDWAAFGAQICL